MTDAKHDPLRDLISMSPIVSDQLRAGFDEQIKELIAGRITGAGRMRRIVAVTVLAVFASLCALGLFIIWDAVTRLNRPWGEALPHTVGFGAGFLLFGAAIFQYVCEIRSGFVVSRRVAKVTFAIRYGSAFLIVVPIALIVFLCLPRNRYLSQDLVIFLVTILTVLPWLVIALFAVRRLAKRYRDDIIIEQKRTQFEIALLRQELAGKSPKA